MYIYIDFIPFIVVYINMTLFYNKQTTYDYINEEIIDEKTR